LENTNFLDYPAGFITERMVREGKLSDCSLLVIPGAKYVNEETVAKIAEYQAKGGRVVVTSTNNLRYDEYGKERKLDDSMKRWPSLAGATPEEYSAQLDKLLDEVGVERPVRVFGKDGKSVWGVELRTASKDGKTILYLVNVSHNTVEFVLKSRDVKQQARDLIGNGTVRLSDSLVLEPRKPMLLELF
jgi:beta-galactosidase GanA